MKSTVIFWYDHPPMVEKGAFNEFSNLWEGSVYYIFANDSKFERKAANWDNGEWGKAKVVTLYDKEEKDLFLTDFISTHPNSIHILNGYDTGVVKMVKPLLFSHNLKALLFTERPAVMGGLFEKIVRKIYTTYKYSKLCREYSPYVKAILPLGIQGVEKIRGYGLEKARIYNFMYCPALEDISSRRDMTVHNPLRFLYVGRFFYKTKGTDVLMKATNYLHGAWQLDMVGGYGKDADKVKAGINKNDHINYLGIWNSSEVIYKMQDYDVIVVPSKADGWNLLINEGMHAGIGIIASDQAVSHEVIRECRGGEIFKSENPKDLADKMQRAIDNHQMVSEWMHNSRGYLKYISKETVGRYFYDIVNYEFYGIGEKPKCPWIKNV